MKLVIIHGPPAAGKLTVANALSRRTYLKVFHNHLTIDCTEPVFEFGTPEFWDINMKLRCDVIAAAAQNDIDIIHTFCYGKGQDDDRFRELVAAVHDNGGDVHVVLVNCRDEIRKERIVDESRARMRKLTDPASIDVNRLKTNLVSPHPDFADETLVIDTSDISPEEAAERIISRFDLSTVDEK